MGRLVNMTEPEIRDLLIEIADYIENCTDSLFMVVVFDDPGVAQYVSNANRKDCIKAMEETAKRFRNNETIERK
jgi:uncharacterized protein with PhoU and TrkA domain